jgi:hypothetical protein
MEKKEILENEKRLQNLIKLYERYQDVQIDFIENCYAVYDSDGNIDEELKEGCYDDANWAKGLAVEGSKSFSPTGKHEFVIKKKEAKDVNWYMCVQCGGIFDDFQYKYNKENFYYQLDIQEGDFNFKAFALLMREIGNSKELKKDIVKQPFFWRYYNLVFDTLGFRRRGII